MPDRLYLTVPGLDAHSAKIVAQDALSRARRYAPKLTGASVSRFKPLHGPGMVGIYFPDPYVWFQEAGIKAFTMRSLAGKVIPMWIDDPRGEERRRNPRARTRTTASGRTQVLIFRRAARPGERKTVRRRRGGVEEVRQVPRSWPGAPGRIGQREVAAPGTSVGRVGGRVARYNVGVRWRHPGLSSRDFLQRGLEEAVRARGLPVGTVVATVDAWR